MKSSHQLKVYCTRDVYRAAKLHALAREITMSQYLLEILRTDLIMKRLLTLQGTDRYADHVRPEDLYPLAAPPAHTIAPQDSAPPTGQPNLLKPVRLATGPGTAAHDAPARSCTDILAALPTAPTQDELPKDEHEASNEAVEDLLNDPDAGI